jgi:membrane complex biogenesis BtpA family protein
MLKNLFGTDKPFIGVIHLLPLPGSSRWDGRLAPIYERAEQEAIALTTGGADGIIIENFFDAPFTKGRLDAVTISTFSIVISRIMALTNKPIGINCLRNDGLSSLAIAAATQAQFIRVNALTGAMVTDQGIIEGIAHELLLYRQHLGASKSIKIFADVLVKHASPLGFNNDICRIAQDTKNRALADALIISGHSTGDPPLLEDLESVRAVLPDCPLLAGSGVDQNNLSKILNIADGAIIGTALKRQNILENPIDVKQVRDIKSAFVNSTDLIKNK